MCGVDLGTLPRSPWEGTPGGGARLSERLGCIDELEGAET